MAKLKEKEFNLSYYTNKLAKGTEQFSDLDISTLLEQIRRRPSVAFTLSLDPDTLTTLLKVPNHSYAKEHTTLNLVLEYENGETYIIETKNPKITKEIKE